MSIFTFKNLYLAYLDCRKTKRNALSAVEFEFALEDNLRRLLFELQEREYEPGRSTCFVVRAPKPREVFAACFRDRVAHHLFVNELVKAGERTFIADSYACRPGKGTHRAVMRLREFLRRGGAGRRPLYFLQLDISGFFMSINKKILISLAEKLIKRQKKSSNWKEEVSWLARKIISHDPTANYQMNSPIEYFRLLPDRKSLFKQPPGQGLPIGNYSSQFFANLYLNELDQFMKRRLRCRYYVRYVDDFLMLHNRRAALKYWMKEIRVFLAGTLDLKISDRKIRLQEAGKGIDFLGYFVKPYYVLCRRAVAARFKGKIREYGRVGGSRDDLGFKAMASSYFGHFSHANCYCLKNKYEVLIKKIIGQNPAGRRPVKPGLAGAKSEQPPRSSRFEFHPALLR